MDFKGIKIGGNIMVCSKIVIIYDVGQLTKEIKWANWWAKL